MNLAQELHMYLCALSIHSFPLIEVEYKFITILGVLFPLRMLKGL